MQNQSVEISLEIINLRHGSIVRPKSQLGTTGFYPKAWQATYINGNPNDSFLANNPNWTMEDIQDANKTYKK